MLDELRELNDGAQAIIVTGYPTIEAAKAALRGRDAYDYLLKRPEEGGPFNIRQYRLRVSEAAQRAIEERKELMALDLSLSTLVAGLTCDEVAGFLFPEQVTLDAAGSVGKVFNRLLFPFRPLVQEMDRVWLSEIDRTCEILCWSREQGEAVLIKIGTERSPLETGAVKWFDEEWYAIKKRESFDAGPVVGVSYIVGEMTFDDFEEQIGED